MIPNADSYLSQMYLFLVDNGQNIFGKMQTSTILNQPTTNQQYGTSNVYYHVWPKPNYFGCHFFIVAFSSRFNKNSQQATNKCTPPAPSSSPWSQQIKTWYQNSVSPHWQRHLKSNDVHQGENIVTTTPWNTETYHRENCLRTNIHISFHHIFWVYLSYIHRHRHTHTHTHTHII